MTTYSVVGNRLSVSVAVTNATSTPIQQIWFEPLALRFPSAVLNYDGVNPIIADTLGQPAVVTLNYGGGVVAAAADSVNKPLQLGFPFASDRPANTTFPLDLNTGLVASYPNSFPFIDRSIPPGSSDQFQFSLRFGPAGSTATSLAPDVYRAFASAFPSTLKWSDRRAIGQLVIATAAAGYPNNPRGWFLDPTVDVTTPAGVAAFQQKLLAFATNSIAILKNMNAQGMITWDIEGEQFPHPITYVGDPRQFAATAPEMSAIADQYFQLFRSAGLRVGVTLRPQQFVLAPDGKSAQQIALSNPTQTLIDKATFAHNRWGSTLFYIDSNVNATDPNPIDPNIIRTLAAMFPDSLFIPEHSNDQYYAYSAPYRELKQGYTSTPAEARYLYPNAATVIYTADGPITADFTQLVTAVQQGDILLYRSWFADPQNQQVASIYQAATGVTSISVSPQSATLLAGQSQQFAANQSVSWSISPPIGTISSNGLYTAPAPVAAQQIVTVTATGVADPSKSASATVALTPAPVISISVNPSAASLQAGQSQQFAATVTGSNTTAVSWSLSPPVGAIAPSGLYTAPASVAAQQAITITATSAADPTRSAAATVTVSPAAPSAPAACPGPATGAFTGCYYQDRGFNTLGFTRVDPQINFNWTGTSPGPGVGPNDFAVRWQGNFNFNSGSYQFTLTTDDGSRLYIDGQLVIDIWAEHPAIPNSKTVTVTGGAHLIQVDYFQLNAAASAVLTWTPLDTVSIVINPTSATVAGGQTAQFAAAVTGSANGAVNWSITPQLGSISATGLYAAPPIVNAPLSVTVTATSLADPAKAASARVSLTPGGLPVSVAISPSSGSLIAGQTLQFSATVSNASNQAVTWSVSPAGAGVISSSGLYSAPVTVPAAQTVTVTATSQADPTKSASAIVTLNAAVPAACGPPSVNAFTGCYYVDRSFGTLGFSRVDSQIAFNWTGISPGNGVGPSNFTVRWQGLFTFAPANYLFTLTTDDGSRLYIDGQLVIDNWGEHPAIPASKAMQISNGAHLIQVDYEQLTGASSAAFGWVQQ